MGFASGKKIIKQIPQGFALGLLTLLPVLIAEYGLGIHSFDQSKQWTMLLLAQKMGDTLLVGLLVAMIEEPLFRGLLITALGKKFPVYAAVLISAVYYASMHFLRSHSKIPSDQVNFSSGFTLLAEAVGNVLNPVNVSAWLALLMVGIFLGA